MALYLVQHGLALPKSSDPGKGLSEQGKAQTKQIAEVAAHYGIGVRRILHSGKRRAEETAAIFDRYLQPPEGNYLGEGLGPLDDVSILAGELDLSNDWMLISHLPLLSRLTTFLIIGKLEPALFLFQNSGIVCIDLDAKESRAGIKWTLMPNIG